MEIPKEQEPAAEQVSEDQFVCAAFAAACKKYPDATVVARGNWMPKDYANDPGVIIYVKQPIGSIAMVYPEHDWQAPAPTNIIR